VPRRSEWTALAPIQRSVETLRPVSPQDFGDSLVSWRNPSFLAPLGHLVSADAPAGVIHRLIEPAAPPSDHPVGSALEYTSAAPQRPAQGTVVQRMLAAISPRTNRESESPPPMTGSGEPSGTRLAASLPNPAPAPDSVAPSTSRSVPVQRSAPDSAQLTQAPPPPLPALELPVLAAPPTTRETASEAESPAAESPAADEPPALGDSAGGVTPTLGTSSPPSATQLADGGVGGPADLTGQEHRASASVIESSGHPIPVNLTVQRMAGTDPDAPAPPELSDGGEAPTLGTRPPPSATQPAGVDGDVSGSAEATDREHGATAPAVESYGPAVPAHPTVQRIAGADPVTPLPSGRSEVGEAPTLGMGRPPSVTQPADDGVGGSAEATGQEHRASTPTIETSGQAAPLTPTAQRTTGPDPTAASRRPGLGPPLASEALTAQRSLATPRIPATPVAKPPLVVPPPPPEPAGPSDVEGPGSVELPPSPGELIAPLIGQYGSVPVQGSAPTTDVPATDAVSTAAPTVQTVQEASPPQAEPTLPVLPVLRAHDSPVSPFANASAPPADLPSGAITEPTRPVPVVSARPVVARLVGDRTPPLLAAPSPTSELADPGGRAQQRLSGAAVSVQRTHAEPWLTGDAPARDHAAGSIEQFTLTGATNVAAGAVGGVALRPVDYPHGGSAPLQVQRMPSVGHPAPVVQAAPPEPAVNQIVAPAPVASPASDSPADSGADVPGGPDNPDQAPSAAPAGVQPAGTPAGPGALGGAASPDELVKKLFDPLLRRLKTELRLDRERRGMLTDLRH